MSTHYTLDVDARVLASNLKVIRIRGVMRDKVVSDAILTLDKLTMKATQSLVLKGKDGVNLSDMVGVEMMHKYLVYDLLMT